MKNLTLLKNSNWDDVFATWQAHEGQDPVWQAFAVNEKGWASWEEWRQYQATQIKAQERAWGIYAIEDPLHTIPEFRMGPFRGWQNNYPEEEKNTHTFADVVSGKREWVANNIGIQSRMKEFPQDTQFIGIYVEDVDQVILFEGHHRAAAVALSVHDKQPLVLGEPTIALTSVPSMSKQELDAMLELGSQKSDS